MLQKAGTGSYVEAGTAKYSHDQRSKNLRRHIGNTSVLNEAFAGELNGRTMPHIVK
jgi:hypothetical protein